MVPFQASCVFSFSVAVKDNPAVIAIAIDILGRKIEIQFES